MFDFNRVGRELELPLVVAGLLLAGVPAARTAWADPTTSFAEMERVRAWDDDDELLWLGFSVAIDGDTMVLGAPFDRHRGFTRGSARVFERDPGDPRVWHETFALRPLVEPGPEYFGHSVAISGDTVVVGSPYETEDAGDHRSGAAYVFERDPADPTAWLPVARLLPDDLDTLFEFGHGVAVDGTTALVGAPGPDSLQGAAYVFERGQGEWLQVARLARDGAAGAETRDLGASVALEGDVAVLGAPGSGPSGTGAAFVFERADPGDPASWRESAELEPLAGSGTHFGYAVALSGDTALVGSTSERAWVFERDPVDAAVWHLEAELQAPDGQPFDDELFGDSVSLSGDTLVVGAAWANDVAGASYVYRRDELDGWSLLARIDSSAGGDLGFGHAVALDGGTIVVSGLYTEEPGVRSGPGTGVRATLPERDIVYVFEEITIDPALSIAGECPGESPIVAAGLTPRGAVRFYGASLTGFVTIPDGPCQGMELGLGRGFLIREGRADGSGEVDVTVRLDPGMCGVPMQVLDETACVLTPVATLP